MYVRMISEREPPLALWSNARKHGARHEDRHKTLPPRFCVLRRAATFQRRLLAAAFDFRRWQGGVEGGVKHLA